MKRVPPTVSVSTRVNPLSVDKRARKGSFFFGTCISISAMDDNKKFREDLLGAVQNRKGDVADAIGMPDEKDYEVLVRIIQRYEKTHPGVLRHTVDTARKEFRAGIYGNRLNSGGEAVVARGVNAQYALELPMDLGRAIEEVFPSMFRSKKHLQWFRQKFPQLTISGGNK